jgi:hypothetical protein
MFCLFALVVASCGDASGSMPAGNFLTEEERAWCSEHPEAHGATASALSIAFVGDYIRASSATGGTNIPGLEPPFLAVPSGDNEPLTYRLQFENSEDSDRACRAAVNTVD